jgi:hypothetical protein
MSESLEVLASADDERAAYEIHPKRRLFHMLILLVMVMGWSWLVLALERSGVIAAFLSVEALSELGKLR